MSVTPTTPDDPQDLTIERAVDMYLDTRKTDTTERTHRFYQNRLRQFTTWCAEHDITTVQELNGWVFEQFSADRRDDLAPTSLKAQMTSVRQLAKYLDRIGATTDLQTAVSVPSISRDQEASDVSLDADRATQLLKTYRSNAAIYGTVEHAFLEVAWHVGARMGGIRALDRKDFNPDKQYLDFQHRPDTGTPLKNKIDGERAVAINAEIVNALEHYIARDRWAKEDEYGREPLFTTRRGRPSDSTLRAWSYLGTHPCIYKQCPHGNEKRSCRYRHRDHASKCPSSRSPHHIRTGSVTWQLNTGVPPDVVAERANASMAVIERHYDVAGRLEKLDERRREYTEELDIGGDAE